MENWKPVPGYEGHYEVSSLGRVKSVKPWAYARPDRRPKNTERLLKHAPMTNGYRFFTPCVNGERRHISVHRAVAMAFLGPSPDGHEVNHKNGDRADNRVENLEYVTHSQNITHGQRTLPRKPTSLRGSMVPNAKLTERKVRSIREMFSKGLKKSQIAKTFGVSAQVVHSVISRTTWKWVD